MMIANNAHHSMSGKWAKTDLNHSLPNLKRIFQKSPCMETALESHGGKKSMFYFENSTKHPERNW
jgi:hypothetical protein